MALPAIVFLLPLLVIRILKQVETVAAVSTAGREILTTKRRKAAVARHTTISEGHAAVKDVGKHGQIRTALSGRRGVVEFGEQRTQLPFGVGSMRGREERDSTKQRRARE